MYYAGLHMNVFKHFSDSISVCSPKLPQIYHLAQANIQNPTTSLSAGIMSEHYHIWLKTSSCL